MVGGREGLGGRRYGAERKPEKREEGQRMAAEENGVRN